MSDAEIYQEKIKDYIDSHRGHFESEFEGATQFLQNDPTFQKKISHLNNEKQNKLIYNIAHAYEHEFVKCRSISNYRTIKRELFENAQNDINTIVRQRQSVDRMLRSKTGQHIPGARDLIQKYTDLR